MLSFSTLTKTPTSSAPISFRHCTPLFEHHYIHHRYLLLLLSLPKQPQYYTIIFGNCVSCQQKPCYITVAPTTTHRVLKPQNLNSLNTYIPKPSSHFSSDSACSFFFHRLLNIYHSTLSDRLDSKPFYPTDFQWHEHSGRSNNPAIQHHVRTYRSQRAIDRNLGKSDE